MGELCDNKHDIEWQPRHKQVIENFLFFLNEHTPNYILKGGTGLMECYNLNRFSEDIDLDGRLREADAKRNGIIDYVKMFCEKNGYSYRISKNTDTVKRCFVHYGNIENPLKIETSFRRESIPENEIETIKGIKVYNINTIAIMKANAFSSRDKIRDLFDVSFIVNRYYEALSSDTKMLIQDAFLHKGIEQFDHLARNDEDNLIDRNKLAESFLSAYDRLGILFEGNEKEEIKELYARDPLDDFER